MSDTMTHWKKLTNPDYLGAYALLPGEEMILTIKSVSSEVVTGTDGKKETCSVMRFAENVKPMVLNSTNAKTISKILKTPYVEQWAGRRIQIYVEYGVKAFGDFVDALRIRPFLPVEENLICADCGGAVEGYGKTSAPTVARYTLSKYGRVLCSVCATAEKNASEHPTDEGVL